MKLTIVEKIKIGKMLREHTFNDINYYDFYNVSSKKSKYNDIDVLEYLLDFVYEEFSKAEVINLNYLLKYIYSIKMFLATIIDSEQTDLISQSYKNKLFALNLKYDEIRKNYPEELSDLIVSELDQIKVLLDVIKVEIDEQTAIEDLKKETKEIKYNKEVQRLNDEIKALKSQNEMLQKRIEKSTKNSTNQSQIINLNNHKIRLLEEELNKLKQNYEELNTKYTTLKDDYENISIENNNKSAEIALMEQTILSQKEKITSYETNEKFREISLKQEEKIEALAEAIFNMITHVQMTAIQILSECNKNGFDTNMDEIKKALMYLQTKVKITNDKEITIPKLYKVENVKPVTNSRLHLTPNPKGYVDIINISDLHVKTINVDFCEELKKVYEYCNKEQINLILNLGDFFGLQHTLKNLSNYENLLAEFAEKLPENEEVMHAILGGNHDYFVTIGGFNVLEKLCNMKEGYLYLGHDHANITFDSDSKSFFSIHHINKKVETDFINLFPDSNAYVNLIGHPHISKFDLMNNNIFVPSLTKDRMCNGALKTRIYFDEKSNIDYMVFTLLKNEKLGLVPVTEIPYKRTLKKQTEN